MKVGPISIGIFCSILLLLLGAWSSPFSPEPYPFKNLFHFPPYHDQEMSRVSVEGAQLGKMLFYDPILSRDSSFSCASCHEQRHAFSNGEKRFSQGIDGSLTSFNVPALFNGAWDESFFWNGRSISLEAQASHPILAKGELDGNWDTIINSLYQREDYVRAFALAFPGKKIDSSLIVKALAQFERTLMSHESKYDRVLQGKARFTSDEYAGFVIANDQSMGDCLHCHPTDAHALGTTGKMSSNGLRIHSDLDTGLFKIPSLRNLAFTAPYMHDGRFASLDEVIDFYSEGVQVHKFTDSKMQFARQGGVRLTQKEKAQLKAFLLTLNDSVFISNPEFSNPFE